MQVTFGLRMYTQKDVDNLRGIGSDRILDRIQRYLDFKSNNGREPSMEEKYDLI